MNLKNKCLLFLFILLSAFGGLKAQSSQLVFSNSHGFYEEGFLLEISTPVPDATIYYTTNGSTPTPETATAYQSGIEIYSTTVLKAIAHSPWVSNPILYTQSYLFPEDIIRMSKIPEGYPEVWGPYTAIQGLATADYEMDQDMMQDNAFASSVKSALQKLPAVSVVTEIGHLFSSEIDDITGGIYMYTGAPITNTTNGTGRGWERPVSVEYFDTNNSSFQVYCGLRIQGGHSRRPEKSPKHSFLLNFDTQYGPNRISYPFFGAKGADFYKKLILRAGFGNSWVHHDNAQRIKSTYLEDIWTKDTQRAMGHPASESTFVHLFLNGIYWGVYALSERMDKDFGEARFGGDDDDYDVIKDYAEVSDGDKLAWDKMMSMANAGLESIEKYQLIQGRNPDGSDNPQHEALVDVVNLADYMIINFYGVNTDWDHHNWAAMRNRVNPGKGFRFMCWDGEMMFGNLNGNILSENNDNRPSRVYQQLLKNTAFKRLMADRIQKHLLGDGALTPDSAAARFMRRKAVLEEPILAESARWGDYRRDVHRYGAGGPFALYTKETHWIPQTDYLLNTYFPQRTAIFLSQLKSAGLFPSVNAPEALINGATISSAVVLKGDKLSLQTDKGSIYYCIDGSDPINIETGLINSDKARLYTQPITINNSLKLVARTALNGEWSAAQSRFLLIPSELTDIKVTEIHYQPLDGVGVPNSEYEFIELKNTGRSTFDLSGFRFSKGISYTFPNESQFAPGEFIVLASNSNEFVSRYNFRPFGEYGGQLDNLGELLIMESAGGDTIVSFAYGNSGDWPTSPAGSGYSLVPVDPNPKGDPSIASNWTASKYKGGSPGIDDGSPTDVPLPVSAKGLKHESFPNPFTTSVYIVYELEEDSHVVIDIYNLSGQKISSLVDEYRPTGRNHVSWDGRNHLGQPIAEGVYIYRLTVTGSKHSYLSNGKMVYKK